MASTPFDLWAAPPVAEAWFKNRNSMSSAIIAGPPPERWVVVAALAATGGDDTVEKAIAILRKLAKFKKAEAKKADETPAGASAAAE